MAVKRIVPVILSGGAGTRLWPLSRKQRPKQLHSLTSASTLLQMTARRVADTRLFAAPIIVSSEHLADEVEAQLEIAGIKPAALILEPVARNTAAAIALAAMEVDPDDLLLVLPSDHVICQPEIFLAGVRAAVPQAEARFFITFGILPDWPEIGYGYVRRGPELSSGVFKVERFVEKPSLTTAQRYLNEGGYYWNGGIFLFRADHLLAGFEVHASDILAGTRSALLAGRRSKGRIYPDADIFSAIRSQSVDHALMEVHDRVAVVPVEMGWSDVGSWDALYDVGRKDHAGNLAQGPVLLRDTRDCLVHSTGPLVLTLGLQDLIIVATGDAILVLPRGKSQGVKEAVDSLLSSGNSNFT